VIDPGTGQTITFTYNDLIGMTLGDLYQAAVWPDLASVLAYLEGQVSPAVLGEKLAAIRARFGLTPNATPTAAYYANEVEGSPGVACSDTLNPRSFAAWQQSADRNERQFGYFGRVWNWTWSSCRVWPPGAGQDRYSGPWTTRTSAPVLVVGNYFDPATRYQGAVTASHLLPNSRLLSYAGWGHAAFFIAFNACVNDNVANYLVTGRTPAPGTVCQPQGSPFDPQSAPKVVAAAATGVVLPAAVRQALRAN